eukprot:1493923-Alexandrium_andersonii.AAC.1
MCSLGGASPKPLRLFGTGAHLHAFVAVAKRRLEHVVKPTLGLTHRSGKIAYTGKASDLEASSADTPMMGFATALAFAGYGAAE